MGRPLAIQSITTKTAKYSSDAPRSFSRNSTASDVAHAISSGPRSFARGSENRPEPAASISRLSARYDARKMTIRTLPNSAGWNADRADRTHSRAPLIVRRARERSAAGAAPARPARSCTCTRRAAGRRGRARASATNATSPTPEPRRPARRRGPASSRQITANPSAGEQRRGRAAARGPRRRATLRTTNHAPMKPAAISEPYSSMLGGTLPRLPSPTHVRATAPTPRQSAMQRSRPRHGPRRGDRRGVRHRRSRCRRRHRAATAVSSAGARRSRRSAGRSRICSTMPSASVAVVRGDAVGQGRVLRQLPRRPRPGCRSRAPRARSRSPPSSPGSPGTPRRRPSDSPTYHWRSR